MQKFAIRLKELRLERGLKQWELAKAVGVSQAAVAQWENNGREPNASVICLFAKFFGVSADYLLGLDK